MNKFINNFVNNKYRRILYLLFFILYFNSCLPVAPIQSSRVNNKLSGGISSIFNKNRHEYLIDTSVIEIKYNAYLSGGVNIGIKNRVELRGIIIPLIYANVWDVNLKVALFDFGKNNLFQSFSCAAFCGSSGNYKFTQTEYRTKNVWGGIVLGTHGIIRNSEIEFVLIPSLTYNDYIKSNEYLIDSIENNIQVEFERKTCDIALGLILTPGKRKVTEINTGLTYKYIFDKKLSISDNRSKILKFDESSLFFHLSLLININKRKK